MRLGGHLNKFHSCKSKASNATLQPPATRIKNCVIIHIGMQVLIRYLRSFSLYQNSLNEKFFDTVRGRIVLLK